MRAWTEALFAKEKKPEERGFEEEGEDTFHRECLPYHAARGFRELSPVGAELKFQRDASDHAQREADAKNLGPEARGVIPGFIAGAESSRFQNEDEKSEAHR